MNYGETLAYWYLRLNGFFPLVDFVLHKHEETIKDSADCDLLAVKLPYSFESIGGLPPDWDQKLTDLGIKQNGSMEGIIVEVKTGDYSRADIDNSFEINRLKYAIQRLGFWHFDQTERIATSLSNQPSFQENGFQVTKLLIGDHMPNQRNETWKKLTLNDIDKFIHNRFKLYREKFRDRHYFPSDLMQYMIWKAH